MTIKISKLACNSKYLADNKLWICAIDESTNEVVGMVSLEFQVDFGWINNLFVNNKFRRMGIGKRLVNAAIEECQQARGICAGINSTNAVSLALFESLGFEHVFSYEGAVRLYTKILK